MRPINVTLCSTTWELAKRKANFSEWVRRKLYEENKEIVDREEKKQMYEAYCASCDLTYSNPNAFMVEHQYCKKCFKQCKYMGLKE